TYTCSTDILFANGLQTFQELFADATTSRLPHHCVRVGENVDAFCTGILSKIAIKLPIDVSQQSFCFRNRACLSNAGCEIFYLVSRLRFELAHLRRQSIKNRLLDWSHINWSGAVSFHSRRNFVSPNLLFAALAISPTFVTPACAVSPIFAPTARSAAVAAAGVPPTMACCAAIAVIAPLRTACVA